MAKRYAIWGLQPVITSHNQRGVLYHSLIQFGIKQYDFFSVHRSTAELFVVFCCVFVCVCCAETLETSQAYRASGFLMIFTGWLVLAT